MTTIGRIFGTIFYTLPLYIRMIALWRDDGQELYEYLRWSEGLSKPWAKNPPEWDQHLSRKPTLWKTAKAIWDAWEDDDFLPEHLK